MTLKDFEYWNPKKEPMYTIVLEDALGHPIGIVDAYGTMTMFDTSNNSRVGTTTNSGDLIVWDGAKPDPAGGFSKGRLLPVLGPPYIDSLTQYSHLARDEKHEKSRQARPRRIKPGTTPSNSPEGREEAA